MRARRLALVGLLAIGAPLATAPSAWADGSLVSPAAGASFADDTVVRVEAEVQERSGSTQLRLVDPLGGARTVATSQMDLAAQTLTYAFDTACPAYPGSPCSGRRPAVNGTWTAQLTGGATDSRTFVLRVPPRAPSDVRVEVTGSREVVVTWSRGAEPDLRGHVVLDADGRTLAEVDDCPSGACRAVLRDDADGSPSVAVRAQRATCPGCANLLAATSEPAAVPRPTEPNPAPAPGSGAADGGRPDAGAPGSAAPGGASPTPGSTSSTPSAGSATPTPGSSASGAPTAGPAVGGSGTARGRDLVLDAGPGGSGATSGGFGAFGPLPSTAGGGALPEIAPERDGDVTMALPFGGGAEEPATVPEQVAARVGGAVASAVDSDGVVRSLAAALVLLLAGAHVRCWLVTTADRSRPDAA